MIIFSILCYATRDVSVVICANVAIVRTVNSRNG